MSTPERAQQRRILIQSAIELLLEEGPAAVSLRRVATNAGMSTQMVYTLFGGKAGLFQAIYEEAFDRLDDAMTRAAEGLDHPQAQLVAMGMAYREFGLSHPTFYRVLFGRPVSEFSPPHAYEDRQRRAFTRMKDSIEACMALGIYAELYDAETITDVFWATVHGLVSLELSGYWSSSEVAKARYVAGLQAVGVGFAVDPTQVLQARFLPDV